MAALYPTAVRPPRTALRHRTSRAQAQDPFAGDNEIVDGIASWTEAQGTTCCALCDESCQEFNMVITAFTEACCAGTEASLALTLPKAGLIITRPLIAW